MKLQPSLELSPPLKRNVDLLSRLFSTIQIDSFAASSPVVLVLSTSVEPNVRRSFYELYGLDSSFPGIKHLSWPSSSVEGDKTGVVLYGGEFGVSVISDTISEFAVFLPFTSLLSREIQTTTLSHLVEYMIAVLYQVRL